MRLGSTFLGRGVKCLAVIAVVSLQFVAVDTRPVAHAQGVPIQATIDQGDIHPVLSLTNTSPVTVTDMPFELSGSVQDITQIQVYVDDVFSVIIPLDEGAATFSYALVMSSGTHTVKLVGISPFADNSPTITVSVTYTPPHIPGEEQGTTTGPAGGSSDSGNNLGGIIIGPNSSTSVSTTYVAPTHTTSLPSWLYNGLLAVDIARPGDTDEQIAVTAHRVAVLATGFSLFIFARPALYGLYLIRFKWFGLKVCRLSRHSHSPSLRFRIIGILLVLGVFSFS